MFIDDTYITPTKVIQGHDGSIVVAYDDYRDELLMELEKRIYNNIKTEYDPAIYNYGTDAVIVDADVSWLERHVGELWWDISKAK